MIENLYDIPIWLLIFGGLLLIFSIFGIIDEIVVRSLRKK